MKKLLYIFLMSSALLHSCSEESTQYSLGIDIQSSFNEDNVQVFIDGKEMLNEHLQTELSTGVCSIDGKSGMRMKREEGDHEITVIVNETVTKTEHFQLNHNLYIGVTYNQDTHEIHLVYSDNQFMYD
jgi:hypothetical protein